MRMNPVTRSISSPPFPKRGLKRCLLSILAILIGAPYLFAQAPQNRPRMKWGDTFGPMKVNDSTDPASDSDIAVSPDQGCVIVWKEQITGGSFINQRRFGRFGLAAGPSAEASTLENANLMSPDVAVAENGCFAAAWMENTEEPLACSPCTGRYWIREYKADGTPYQQGDCENDAMYPCEDQLNITGDWAEGPPVITAADTLDLWPHGNAPNVPWGVAWQPDEPTYQENTHFSGYSWLGGQDIRLDPYDARNRPIGISVTGSGDEFIVFYVLWTGGNWASCRARKVDLNNNPVGNPMPFQIPASSLVQGESATLNEIGQVGVAWIEWTGSGSEVWFQGYTFTGDAIVPFGDPEIAQSTGEYVDDVAIASSDNRFVVAWNQAEGPSIGDLSHVYIRRMHAGYPGGYLPIRVDNDATTVDKDPSVAVSGKYGYVSWTKAAEGSNSGDIYAAKIDMGPER